MKAEVTLKNFLITLALSIILIILRAFGIFNTSLFYCFIPVWLTFSIKVIYIMFYILKELLDGEH